MIQKLQPAAGACGERSEPAEHLAACGPQAGGSQLPVEFVLCASQGAAQLALRVAQNTLLALGRLEPGEFGAHFSGHRALHPQVH